MYEAVFISDLHLNPEDDGIEERFYHFITWAAHRTKAVYILGDFVHAWPGDDALDDWSRAIALRLRWLTEQGIKIYFMPGNRDFLIGKRFINLAKMVYLPESSVMKLGDDSLLLSHGDRYCTLDKSHQWLRRLTRNLFFPWMFVRLPYSWRAQIVRSVRKHSQMNQHKSAALMNIVPQSMLKHLNSLSLTKIIHGHIHRPGLTTYDYDGQTYAQFVLSDWDDNPNVLCYDKSSGIKFIQFLEKINGFR